MVASSHAPDQRQHERATGGGFVEQLEQSRGRPVGGEYPAEQAEGGGRHRDEQALDRLRERHQPGRRSDGAPDADRAKPPLHLGARRRGQHHARGDERDQRQRDEQVDHDPGGLVEQDPDARAVVANVMLRRP